MHAAPRRADLRLVLDLLRVEDSHKKVPGVRCQTLVLRVSLTSDI